MNGINFASSIFGSLLNASSDSSGSNSFGNFESDDLFKILLSAVDDFQSDSTDFSQQKISDSPVAIADSFASSASSSSAEDSSAPSASSAATDKLIVDYSQAYSQQLNVQRGGNQQHDVRMYAQTQQEAVSRTLNVIDRLLKNPQNLDSETVSQLQALRSSWNDTIHPSQIAVQNAGNPYAGVASQIRKEQLFLNKALKLLNGDDKQGLRDINGNIVADVINQVKGDRSS